MYNRRAHGGTGLDANVLKYSFVSVVSRVREVFGVDSFIAQTDVDRLGPEISKGGPAATAVMQQH